MNHWRPLVALCLVAATGLAARVESVPSAASALLNIPYRLGPWEGRDEAPADPQAEEAMAADQILDRSYRTPGGDAADLYVAYYARQRPGVSIHSPLHCLPGTGWDVLSARAVPAGTSGAVRRLVARKGSDRILVLYWYAIHGRMIASDLGSRVQLLADRLRLGRNDATLVRLVMPIADSEAAAERTGQSFIGALEPYF